MQTEQVMEDANGTDNPSIDTEKSNGDDSNTNCKCPKFVSFFFMIVQVILINL